MPALLVSPEPSGVEVNGVLVGFAMAFGVAVDSPPVNADNTRSISEAHPLFMERNVSSPSCVAHLLGASRPSTIGLSVVPVVVDAFQGHSRWALSHVSQEVLEFSPSRVEGDSPAAIVFDEILVGAETPISHLCPATVRPGPPVSVCGMALVAPACGRAPGTEVIEGYNLFVPAVAADQDIPLPIAAGHLPYHCEASKSVPRGDAVFSPRQM